MALTIQKDGDKATIYTETAIAASAFSTAISTVGAKCVFIEVGHADADVKMVTYDTSTDTWAATLSASNTKFLDETAVVDVPTATKAGFIAGHALPPRICIYNGHSSATTFQVIVVHK